MAGDEESVLKLDSPIPARERQASELSRRQTESHSEAGDWRGPQVVPPRDREPVALQLGADLTEAIARFLQDAERQVLIRAERARSSALADLDRQRANIESLIGMFAERLQQQEAAFSALQEKLERALPRLDKHAEAIRSLSDAQAQYVKVLHQLEEVLRRFVLPAGNPGPPRIAV